MINICNIAENFNKNKKIIVDFFIDYYGQEYYDLINKRINSTYIDFSSNPVDDYKYAMNYDNNISSFNKTIITLKYKLYIELEKKSKKNNYDLLAKYILNNLLIINQENFKSNKDFILSLFSDENFNSGLIDIFSSKNNDLLNDNRVDASIKKRINNDRKKINEVLINKGINISNLTSDFVDKFIEYRKQLQEKHKKYIVKNSLYGKNIFKDFKSEFNLELQPEILSIIGFIENASTLNIIVENNDITSFYNYIRVPLTHLINIGIKGLDVNIIHELIHKIETNKDRVGISILNNENTNKIINEIRTQKLAICFTKKLHEQGIFIYDNPNDYKIEGESAYEWMFPISESFLEEFEKFFSNCAINNDIEKLNDYFGVSWITYSDHINKVFNDNIYFYMNFGKISNIQLDENVTSIINEMKLSSRKVGIKKCLKI